MATVEITCPHCNRNQKVAEYRLKETVYCLVCQQLITDVYLYKVAPKQQELNIKLKGRLVSEFGTTKLEELKSKADEYTGRFEPVDDDDEDRPDETTRLFESGGYKSMPEKPRMSVAAKTYLIAGVSLVVMTAAVLSLGFALLDRSSGPQVSELEATSAGGMHIDRYPGGARRAEWQAVTVDGIDTPHGTWQEWHLGGQLKLTGTYNMGKRTGTWTGWHENGQKAHEHFFEDGVEHGTWVEWHPNGRKSREGRFVQGAKEGEWRTWHLQGSVESYEKYEDGLATGDWVTWFPDGRIATSGGYEKGLRVGRWVTNYDNGNPQTSETWAGGRLHGEAQGYYPNRREAWRGVWAQGKRTGMWVWWYGTGQMSRRGVFNDDRESGAWQEWHERGTLKSEGVFDQGRRHGTWIENHEDGTLAARRVFERGTMTSEHFYYAGSEVQSRREAIGSDGTTRQFTVRVNEDGIEVLHGVHRTMRPNGIPIETGAYYDGAKHGIWRTYDAVGDVIDTAIFDQGTRID